MPHSYPTAQQRQAQRQPSGQSPAANEAESLPGAGSPGAETEIVPPDWMRLRELATNVVPSPAASRVEQVRVRSDWLGAALPQLHPGLMTPPKCTACWNSKVTVTISGPGRPVVVAPMSTEMCRSRRGSSWLVTRTEAMP